MGKPLSSLPGMQESAGDGADVLREQASIAKAWVRRIDDLLDTVTFQPVLEILSSIRTQVEARKRISQGQQDVITRAEDRQDHPRPRIARRYEGF